MSQTQNGKPLLIPEYVSRVVRFEEENILSADSKLLLTVGNKKPTLSSVSVEQDIQIANLRIFFELLSLNCLPTLADVREYLSYSIKIYELAKKYSWGSVLHGHCTLGVGLYGS